MLLKSPGDYKSKHLACLATLKSCDTTKQSVYGWQYTCSPFPGTWALERICNYYRKNSFTYVEDDDKSTVRYPTGLKSVGFRSRLEVSRVSSHTEKLWYNETVCLGMTIYIYIYIYIYCVCQKLCNILVVCIYGFFYNARVSQKVLQCFDKGRYNSTVKGAFATDVKTMMNQLDREMPSSPNTLGLLLPGIPSIACSTALLTLSELRDSCNSSETSLTISLL